MTDQARTFTIKDMENTENQTPEKPEKLRPLTRKQQAFIKHLVENPKASASEAARQTYGREGKDLSDGTARAIASENLTKPNILAELARHSETAEMVLHDVLITSQKAMHKDTSRSVDWASNARQTADSILDRLHGKATQRTEVKQSTVVLNVDLTAPDD